ncbi:MAG: hypothetical protein A2504_08390 [Bdellovibrionales bacterium RIFOXYD12_FULL_39_22]|nr:MAG: hypothetical protein A2385_01615 [Bdellovibrionales bacterium RIFOXYB1_FULL_39_21]OFZ42857.1 MAG: hypothetical protein A2485_10755 [Bdellovibrionales bacterium RIFOXYC12_FULL_39_17]OFZ47483.1 MAG: hypothetical protein A2404_14535 [Bdellovibrionales bacterium RIFOXYC1_FULL_39_130]OFZ75571.1 MAG: hypothetical protein A2560_14685 [Bdellovibrionales bacterium RIFOXYD1_FULL_39_84]OFZ93894.1 MAG: hypothetical protein A2504_08390 [Bdellovibrionales bacterium RIFOXYD12_FULL_39_22]
MIKNSLLLLLMFIISLAVAGDLKAPFSFSSASILPKGVRNFNYKGVFISGTDKFDDGGTIVPLGSAFSKNITYQTLIDSKKLASDKAAIEQTMDDLLANEQTVLAQTLGEVNVVATAYVPVLAWGLSSKFTLALAVPIVETDFSVSTGSITNDDYYAFKAAIHRKGALKSESDLQDKIERSPIESKMVDYGYKSLAAEHETSLGDFKLIGKYLAKKTKKSALLLRPEITLPTGKVKDPDKLIDVSSGDGQLDLGLGLAYELQIGSYFFITSSLGYTAQLPDNVSMRIPEVADSSLSPDKDTRTYRNLGDMYMAELSAKMVRAGITLQAGYALQYKEHDHFDGEKFAAYRYNWAEQNTRQNMQTAQFSVGYDTIALFKSKKFIAPLAASLNHTIVVDGKNVTKDPLTSFDLSLFF